MAVGVWKAVLRQWLQAYKNPRMTYSLILLRLYRSAECVYDLSLFSRRGNSAVFLRSFPYGIQVMRHNTEDPDYNGKCIVKRFFVGCVISGGCTLNSLVLNWFLQIIHVGRMNWNIGWLISVSLRVCYNPSFKLFPWGVYCNVLSTKFAHS